MRVFSPSEEALDLVLELEHDANPDVEAPEIVGHGRYVEGRALRLSWRPRGVAQARGLARLIVRDDLLQEPGMDMSVAPRARGFRSRRSCCPRHHLPGFSDQLTFLINGLARPPYPERQQLGREGLLKGVFGGIRHPGPGCQFGSDFGFGFHPGCRCPRGPRCRRRKRLW